MMMNLQMCLVAAHLIRSALKSAVKPTKQKQTHLHTDMQTHKMPALTPLHTHSTGKYTTPPPIVPFPSPAERVLAADPPQLQTIGFILIFIGAIRHDSLPASFGTALTLAGAEKQPVAELSGHTVQE